MKINIFYLVILILLIMVWLARKSNNDDIVKKHTKSATDTANIKNARKVYKKTITQKIMLITSIVLFIVIAVCTFTNIDVSIANYFSYNLITEINIDYNLFFVPLYILAAKLIILEVNVGDFALKYFKTKEEEPNIKIDIKSLLYKKPKPTTEENTTPKVEEAPKAEETPKQVEPQPIETPKEETKDTQ